MPLLNASKSNRLTQSVASKDPTQSDAMRKMWSHPHTDRPQENQIFIMLRKISFWAAHILRTCIIDSTEISLWHQRVITQVLTEYLNGKKDTVEIQSCGSTQFQSMKQEDMLGELYFIH